MRAITGPMEHDYAAQMIFEAIMVGLEGADDDDTVRPKVLLDRMREGMPEVKFDFPDELTVAEMRDGAREAIARLADPVAGGDPRG